MKPENGNLNGDFELIGAQGFYMKNALAGVFHRIFQPAAYKP